MAKRSKTDMRRIRHARIRKKISGTPEQPRLAVFKSGKHIYAQIIDDVAGHTLAAASSVEKGLKADDTIEGAKRIGKELAKRATEKKIKRVVFDRGGSRYHGAVAGLADGAREGGLEF
ncbi:50S ribosomal protein L18 [Kamptonema cortianum]|nr:50S ribosomal protein L18 [Geitlerinema splendidum]MDK3162236.1 50S ribosomal protein L18 [Kamptonema cortianum]